MSEKEDQRLINFIFDHWFYLSWRSGLHRDKAVYPNPGFCRYVEFTEEEIEQLRKEHDA